MPACRSIRLGRGGDETHRTETGLFAYRIELSDGSMPQPMKTLDQHNTERRKQIEELRQSLQPHPNGIACPKCSAELWDTDPMMMLASCPPQKNVHCPSCGYRGYALA